MPGSILQAVVCVLILSESSVAHGALARTEGLQHCPLLPGGSSHRALERVVMARRDLKTKHCFRPFVGDLLAYKGDRVSVGNMQARDRQRPGAKSLENQGQIVVHLPVMSSQADVTNSLNISVAANWTSCAVVGNSNSLKGRSNSLPTWSLWDTNCQLGHASPGGDYVMSLSCCPVAGRRMGSHIDKATAVFRFNDAPVRGQISDVGSFTTLRIQNFLYCGYHESPVEHLLYNFGKGLRGGCMSKPAAPRGKAGKIRPGKGFHASFELLHFSQFFRGVDSEDRQPSGGFFGVLLALHLCGEVRVYGFNQGGGHYYSKGFGTNRQVPSVRGRHSWPEERRCLNAYNEAFAGSFQS